MRRGFVCALASSAAAQTYLAPNVRFRPSFPHRGKRCIRGRSLSGVRRVAVLAHQGPVNTPIVALFTGPPGTGKSTLADTIGRELPAPVFAWDWLMAPLTQVEPIDRAMQSMERRDFWSVGYALLDQCTEKQLRNGQSALIDCVARAGAEARWAATANRR